MSEPFVTTQRLRYCDTDRVGHINNSVYAVMCEAGRVELLDYLGLLSGKLSVVIARLEIDFLREMNWPGDVRIETWVARIGTKSLHTRQAVLFGGEVVARARAVLAAIDPATRRAVAIGDDWRAALAPFHDPDNSPS